MGGEGHGGWGEGHHEHGEWDEREHGEWGEGHHEHGHHHEHGEWFESHDVEEFAVDSSMDEDSQSAISIPSFIAGTAFGLLLWGPTLALIVYHKKCRGGDRHGDTSVEYKPAVMA